ncbi:hypothetical protein GGF41_008817 [Coemansia sp. RSA 2531]|nr:hypothetical protein GGF41_008817 [Coemansia sp. RSA 2531]
MILVRQPPLRSDLETDTLTFGSLPEDTTTKELSEFRHVNVEMGSRFWCWHIRCNYHAKGDYARVVICLLLMALGCPNFNYVTVGIKNTREPYMKAMQGKIDKP